MSDKIYTYHVFICERCKVQELDGPPDLALNFRKSVKQKAMLLSNKEEIRINGSACLGQCEKGISCIIYPQGEWILNLKPGEEQRILEKLRAKDE